MTRFNTTTAYSRGGRFTQTISTQLYEFMNARNYQNVARLQCNCGRCALDVIGRYCASRKTTTLKWSAGMV